MSATGTRMFGLLLVALTAGAVLLVFTPGAALSQDHPGQPTAEPGMMFDLTDRLAPPPMSDPPTQIEQGAYAYYLSCMVCHGDRGQGLTEEWRGALDPADQNCWQSRCHAPNHPPGGFQLPRYAPAIIGSGMLAHYESAAGLYEFLRTRMPWQAPGILEDEVYWHLTAFLLDANGFAFGTTELGPDNAAQVRMDTGSEPPAPTLVFSINGPLLLVTVAALLLFGLGFLWRQRHAR
jgi:mono/diheme cytochrome c family protein